MATKRDQKPGQNAAATPEQVLDLTPELPQIETVDVRLPLATGTKGAGYAARHVELQLNVEQSLVLNRFFRAVSGQRLRSGRVVDTPGRAIMWLLDGVISAEAPPIPDAGAAP